MVADLWFAYGSPGFDASLWPDKWYDGTEMNSAHYAACAHILVSDTYTSDGSYALYGCNADFKSWARKNVIGFGTDGSMINSNASGPPHRREGRQTFPRTSRRSSSTPELVPRSSSRSSIPSPTATSTW